MKVLIDTNVLLDVLSRREPFYSDSAQVWTLAEQELIDAHIAAISVNNLYYIVRRLRDRQTADNVIDKLLDDFEIIELSRAILSQARAGDGNDFEDLIQYFSAIHAGCEVVVTRNKQDFPTTGLRIMTPRELLDSVR